MKSQVVFKKSFEENSESQEKFFKTKVSKNSQKNSSKISPKENKNMNLTNSALNVGNQIISTNSEIFELIESLHQKIKTYEEEIGNLLDEKIQMQMTISKLQLERTQNNQNEASAENEANKTSEIKNQLNTLNNNIERQKGILDRDYSILTETINDSVFNPKTQRNLQSDIIDLNTEKVKISKDLQELKEELIALIELQKTVSEKFENENNFDIKSEKSNSTNKNLEVNNPTTNVNFSNSEDKINLHEKDFSINLNMNRSPAVIIPNIDRYFVLNGKISLVDSDNYLWHLTKCDKYEKAKNNSNSLEKEKFLIKYLANYQKISSEKQIIENKNDEVTELKQYGTIQKHEEDPMTIVIKENKSQFDSNIMNNLTTINTNRNSEKNYDSLGLNNDTEIKVNSKDEQIISDDSGLNLDLDNNSSLILSESD